MDVYFVHVNHTVCICHMLCIFAQSRNGCLYHQRFECYTVNIARRVWSRVDCEWFRPLTSCYGQKGMVLVTLLVTQLCIYWQMTVTLDVLLECFFLLNIFHLSSTFKFMPFWMKTWLILSVYAKVPCFAHRECGFTLERTCYKHV